MLTRNDHVALGREELKRRLDAKIGFFSYHPLFQRWPRAKLLALATAAKERVLSRGACVYAVDVLPTSISFSRDGEFELAARPSALFAALSQHTLTSRPPPVSDAEANAELMEAIDPSAASKRRKA